MPTYTNPTGTFSATEGDDTIIFNKVPTDWTTAIDALGGRDSLLVQIDTTGPMTFEVRDTFNSGVFNANVSLGPYDPQIIVYNVEDVEFHGTSSNDTFHLQLGSDASGLAVSMDGRAGQDLLQFDWSRMTSGISFVVSGTGIASSFGTFTSFEVFEIHAGSGDDTITTGSGNDNVYTGTGADIVRTGSGNDYIYSESTGGSVNGGDGYDYYQGNFSASTANLSISIGDTINQSNGIDVTNIESMSARANANASVSLGKANGDCK